MVKAKAAKPKAVTSKKRSRTEEDDDADQDTVRTSKSKAKAPAKKKAKPSASQSKSKSSDDAVRQAVKSLLKDLASEHLNDIEDDEERQTVQQGLSTLVKGLLAKLKTGSLPEAASLMPADQVNSASTSKLAPDQTDLKDLRAQLKEEEAQLAQETAAFKNFCKSRHEVEAIEREEQAAKLHPLVKVLYPEMGNPKSTLVDEAAAEEQPWLREALERLEAEEKDVSKVDEDLYDPNKDKWLKKYSGDLLQLLGKIDHATSDLEILSESVVAATSALDVGEED